MTMAVSSKMKAGGAQLIRLSKKDRESYQFSKYNIYITGVSLKIEDALLVDADAVYEETENEEIKNFVYLVENGKLHKRYIVSNYKQEKTYLVNQGLEEVPDAGDCIKVERRGKSL